MFDRDDENLSAEEMEEIMFEELMCAGDVVMVVDLEDENDSSKGTIEIMKNRFGKTGVFDL